MNFNKYFCNTEKIYLMQGILELDNILSTTPGPANFFFVIGKNKLFIIDTHVHLPDEVWVKIEGKINIARNRDLRKEVISAYKVRLI